MANLCSNELYVYSETPENIEVIEEFFSKWPDAEASRDNSEEFEAWFSSRWCFPEKEMQALYESIPNKEDIYIRCLSVEYGNDYIAYHKCEREGWYNALN